MEPTFQSIPTPNPAQLASTQQRLILERQMWNGVNWFFWIAGLSLVNSVINLFGGALTFVVGLGATLVVEVMASAIADELGSGAEFIRIIGFGISLAIMGVFALLGWLGRRRQRWAMVVGMVLYALDGLIFLAFGDFLPVIFHGLALWSLGRGLMAMNALKKLELSTSVSVPSMAQPISAFQPSPSFTPVVQPVQSSRGFLIVGGLALLLLCGVLAAVVLVVVLLPSPSP